jgi:transposase InsO family protein
VSAVDFLKRAGYSVAAACQAIGLSRSGYYASKRPCKTRAIVPDVRELVLIEKIKGIKTRHPFWGYRRVWAWLRYREGMVVNQKRVRRFLKEHKLMATQTVHKAKRTSSRSKPHADRPKQFWGIDMTKFMINALGWVYLVIVLDWYTKKIVGWHISVRSKTVDWQQAMNQAINGEFPEGVRDAGLRLISDNGSQPTSVSFMRDMKTLNIEQIFTSYNNPKGNADTERVVRTIKEEVIWLNEFETFSEAKATIGRWIEHDYNKLYVHSTLDYMSPEEFEVLYNRRELKLIA